MDRVQTHDHSPNENLTAADHARMWDRFIRSAFAIAALIAVVLALMGLFLV